MFHLWSFNASEIHYGLMGQRETILVFSIQRVCCLNTNPSMPTYWSGT